MPEGPLGGPRPFVGDGSFNIHIEFEYSVRDQSLASASALSDINSIVKDIFPSAERPDKKVYRLNGKKLIIYNLPPSIDQVYMSDVESVIDRVESGVDANITDIAVVKG